jgi:glycosyltransferase involved in cell wall biosynthesis
VRVVVDVAPLSHPRTGVGNYIRGSLLGLAATETDVLAFAPVSARGKRTVEEAIDGIAVERKLPVVPAAHALRTAWSRLGRPAAEHFVGSLDVLHFSDWMYPPQRAGLRSTMIHDLVPLHHPEWVHARTARMHGAKYRHVARTCDVVIVNSRFTGDDVAATLDVPHDRIHVAYPGVEPAFRPDGTRTDLGRPYALTVATLEPRKNLQVLVDAHRRLEADLALAVAGAPGWGEQPSLDGAGIVSLGYTNPAELPDLYRGAAVFCYPSLFEGFGMPILEAMACGTPVVASTHESLDEACGTAALRADPHDPDAWATRMLEAIERSEELSAQGIEHARGFTWEANARAHLDAWAR